MEVKKITDNTNTSRFSLGISTIVLGVALLIIPLVFFFLLDQQLGSGFGISEILFSIVFAIVAASFLLWIKSLMGSRPYLGLIVGLVALVAFEYSLFFRYVGSYTVTFVTITAIVALIYLGIHFIKSRKNSGKIIDDFDTRANS